MVASAPDVDPTNRFEVTLVGTANGVTEITLVRTTHRVKSVNIAPTDGIDADVTVSYVVVVVVVVVAVVVIARLCNSFACVL